MCSFLPRLYNKDVSPSLSFCLSIPSLLRFLFPSLSLFASHFLQQILYSCICTSPPATVTTRSFNSPAVVFSNCDVNSSSFVFFELNFCSSGDSHCWNNARMSTRLTHPIGFLSSSTTQILCTAPVLMSSKTSSSLSSSLQYTLQES